MISLLSILLLPCFYAALLKLAAVLYQRTSIGWSHALVFGVLAVVAGVLGVLLNRATGAMQSLPLGVLIGLAQQLVLGGWYLSSRAKARDGALLGFKRGVLLSLIAYVLVMSIGVISALIIPAMLHVSKAP